MRAARQELGTLFTTRIVTPNMSPSATPSVWRRRRSEPSVGSVGESYDNALAETINGMFKAGVIHRRGP